MKSDKDELIRVFNQTYTDTFKDGQNNKQFSKVLDARFEKLLDEWEETIRLPFEKMISNYRLSMQKLKKHLYQEYKVDEIKTL